MNKRLGRFEIVAESVEQPDSMVSTIMSQCVPVRVEYDVVRRVYVYTAISWRFRKLAECEAVPEYIWVFNSGEFGPDDFECHEMTGF